MGSPILGSPEDSHGSPRGMAWSWGRVTVHQLFQLMVRPARPRVSPPQCRTFASSPIKRCGVPMSCTTPPGLTVHCAAVLWIAVVWLTVRKDARIANTSRLRNIVPLLRMGYRMPEEFGREG